MKYLSVIVNNPSSQVDMEYEYVIDDDIINSGIIQKGSRVEIPFGNANRLIYGVITDINDNPKYDGDHKTLVNLPDIIPLINEEQFELEQYIKTNLVSPSSSTFNAMIPSLMRTKTLKYVQIVDKSKIDADIFEEFNGNSYLKIDKKVQKYLPRIQKLIKAGALELNYQIESINKRKTKKVYSLNQDNQYKIDLIIKNQTIRDLILNIDPKQKYDKNQLNNLGLSDYMINKLIDNSILSTYEEIVSRIKKRNYDIDLNHYLNYANNDNKRILSLIDKSNVPVLWKVERDEDIMEVISLKIIENLNNQSSTIIFVPDILSTYKFQSLIANYLGSGIEVVSLNNELSETEVYDIYQDILADNLKVIITTNISTLWPYQNIGSIFVIDEESDNYYNDFAPRYSTIDILKLRSKFHNAKLILTSNIISSTSYYQAINKQYELIESKPVINPNLVINAIDMREEIKSGNYSPLSRTLQANITKHYLKKEPILIILNNKGYSDFVLCRTCGHVERCPKCQTVLKYRSKDNHLVCPNCSYHFEFINTCSSCGSKKIKMFGLGAEKLQELLLNDYPDMKIKIVDNNKYAEFKKITEELNNHELDLVISSSTYERGFINSNFKLVCVLALDLVLKRPSYNATTIAYAMLNSSKHLIKNDGDLLIQTYDITNYTLNSFLNNQSEVFTIQDLKNRRDLSLPPYFNYDRILVKGKYEDIFKVSKEIIYFLKRIYKEKITIYGPTYNYANKASQLILKYQNLDLNLDFQNIYQKYAQTENIIIFDRYVRNLI